jgi:hypothetical protein
MATKMGTSLPLVDRVKNIVFHPDQEWPIIASEPSSASALFSGYVIPLAAIPAIASFIGLALVGVNIPFVGTYRTPIVSALGQSVASFILSLIGIFVLSLVIDALAPKFDGRQNRLAALKVTAYAATPGFVAGILSIFPGPLAFVQLFAGLYGIYLIYTGLPVLMHVSKERSIAYTLVVIIVAFLVAIVTSMILAPFRKLAGGLH